MSANVLLINPWEPGVYPPPGIGYIAAAIRQELPGVEVCALDLPFAFEALNARKWDYVCASFTSFSAPWAKPIRDLSGAARLVCGGHHPSTAIGKRQMKELGYEVIQGEGEEELVNLIASTPGKARFRDDDGKRDINLLPFPDYRGLAVGDRLPIISSRGCPFACSFCASSAFWGRRWYPRTPDNVLAEIEHWLARGHRAFMFEDDNFTLDPSRAAQICKGIPPGISWDCASRAETLRDRDLCECLAASGCREVWLGVESLSQPVLNMCHKNTTVEAQEQGIRTAIAAGLKPVCQFIVGLPGDTEQDIRETCRRIKALPPARYGANIAWVLPDTDIYRAARLTMPNWDDNIYLLSGAPFYTGEQTMETLLRWRQMINTAQEG